jgi:hypothetical protein
MRDAGSRSSWCLCRRAVVTACSALFLGAIAHAEPSVPWTPSAAGRHAIQLLIDEAGLALPATQWPLPRGAVRRAVEALPPALPLALAAARERLKREMQAQEGSQLVETLRNPVDALPGFGDDPTPGSSLAIRSPTLSSRFVALQLGARIEKRAHADSAGVMLRPDDSAVVVELLGLQLQAWSHRSWWGPGWQSALELSSNTPALNALGVQRASASRSESPWLAWMGPWSFDFFVARTEGVTQPGDPLLLGTRFTLRPFSHLEIGVTRTAQWGGDGHDTSARSFARLLLGVGSNADDAAEQSNDPGNQIAGLDLRLRCPLGLRCAAYAQLAGEDEAGFLPSNALGLYGAELWSPDGEWRLFAEYAETGCRSVIGRRPEMGCAYRNYAYPQGYVNAGRWLGASIGPDSRLATLGWIDAVNGGVLKLHLGHIGSRIGSYSPFAADPRTAGRLYGLSARRSFAWGVAWLTPELDWSRVDAPAGRWTQARIGLTLRVSLDGAAP